MGTNVSMGCAFHVAPPSTECRIVPLAPMIHPRLSLAKNTPVNCTGVPLVYEMDETGAVLKKEIRK